MSEQVEQGDYGAVEIGQVRPRRPPGRRECLTPDDVDVQAVTGRVDNNEELSDLQTAPMTVAANTDGYRYETQLPLNKAGSIGYTVRIIPKNDLLAAPAELGLVINA